MTQRQQFEAWAKAQGLIIERDSFGGGESQWLEAAFEGWQAAQAQAAPTYTTGHCKNKAQPGGCQLHNLQCGYPECDRQAAAPVQDVYAAVASSHIQNIRCVKPLECPKCHALWLFWPKEQSGFATDTLSVKSATHCNYCEYARADQLLPLGRVPTPDMQAAAPDTAFAKCLLSAAAKSGDSGAIALAAQLAGVPPCKGCGYVIQHCRCVAQAAAEPVASSNCPICGENYPHAHWSHEVVYWLQAQASRFIPDWEKKITIRDGAEEWEELVALKSKLKYTEEMLTDADHSVRCINEDSKQAAVESVLRVFLGTRGVEVTKDYGGMRFGEEFDVYTSPPDHTKAMKLALVALNNSVDLVWEEYTEAERSYGNYPTRRAKLDGMKAMAQEHSNAIAALEECLK